ncbi:MAG: peptidase inhibitor family I36 protein [Pseudonocardiales bacterium]|nr:peptidase inhibitor family I36 protein [Pseudonocardiales bacterium]
MSESPGVSPCPDDRICFFQEDGCKGVSEIRSGSSVCVHLEVLPMARSVVNNTAVPIQVYSSRGCLGSFVEVAPESGCVSLDPPGQSFKNNQE